MRRALLALLLATLAACGPEVDRERAVQHLVANRAQLDALRADVVPRLPPDLNIEIGLSDDDLLDFKVLAPEAPGASGENSVIAWGVAEDSPEVARGLEMLGWTPEDFRRVHEQIVALGGIGLKAPTLAGGIGLLYRRADKGRYYFFVADSSVVSEARLGYNGCDAHWADRSAGLVFESGALGPICMPGGEVNARY